MERYDSRTALIVVDVQNDFADAKGSLYVKGGDEAVAFVNREIALAAGARSHVFYTQDWHPRDTPHFAKDGGIWPVHCVQDTWGAQLHPALLVEPGASVIRKGTNGEDGYSGFTMRDPSTGSTMPTELDHLLLERDVERVVVVGLATDYCVLETALDARRVGYPTTLVSDAVRAVDLEPGDGQKALDDMVAAGVSVE